MPIVLKGGTITGDRRLDRIQQFDERSRYFPIRAVVPDALRSISWPCRPRLDQGREGACVGFSWSHELAAYPVQARGIDNATALFYYHEAQKIDEWPGEAYSGTSVLAGAKVALAQGYIAEYRWAFSIDEALRAISHAGPVVLGIPWKDSMYDPRPDGLLDCSGKVIGGHAILARGLRLRSRLAGVAEPVIRLRNSWGADWGTNRGDCFIRVSELEALLKEGGDCCVPLGRKLPSAIASLRYRIAV